MSTQNGTPPYVEHHPSPDRNLVSKKFGRLLVIGHLKQERIRNDHARLGQHDFRHYVRCRCDCGVEKVVRRDSVQAGVIQSCDCLDKEMHATGIRGMSHGDSRRNSRKPEYSVWSQMRARCGNPKHPEYFRYGGRGIRVCERWGDYANFATDMGDRPHGGTLDRVDVDGNYEPGNCRWATPKEQTRNRRVTIRLTFNGRIQSMADWADELGVTYSTFSGRVKKFGGEKAIAITQKKNQESLRPEPGVLSLVFL